MKRFLVISLLSVVTLTANALAGTVSVDVNDGGCVSGTGQPDPYAAVYCAIQDAIDDAAASDTIMVSSGTYNGSIDVTKPLTLQSVSGAASTTIAGDATTAVLVSADNVMIDGFTITNPSGKHGIFADDQSFLAIQNNIVTNVGATDATSSGTNFGIAIECSAADIQELIIRNNVISDITGGDFKSADGISLGWSNGDFDIINPLVFANTITNVTSSTLDYSSGGRGAYGILLNHARSSTYDGQTVSPVISDNTITNLEGLWAHAIGLEGNTPNALVEGNIIDTIIDHKSPSDSIAVFFEDNASVDTAVIENNSFTNVSWGVAAHPVTAPGNPNASGNWWGSNTPSAVAAMVTPGVDYTPWLDSGVDTDGGTAGFQGDFSTLWADDDSTQTGAVSRINEAIARVTASTIYLAPGDYLENVVIDKKVAIIGSGSGDDPMVDSIVRKDANTHVFELQASGASAADPILLKDLRIMPQGVNGIEVHNGYTVSFLELDNVQFVGPPPATIENENGIRIATTGSLSDVAMRNCSFQLLDYGWYFAKASGADTTTASDFLVENTSFIDNSFKGIYAEKLENAVFRYCSVTNNGSDPFWNSDYNAGIDINLKYQDYANIRFECCTFSNNGLGYREGVGLWIKARDDAPSYSADPASLTGVEIIGGTFDGNERGLRFGESGKDNLWPTNVVVESVNFLGSAPTYPGIDGSAYGDLIDQRGAGVDEIVAEDNYWGQASGPAAGQVVNINSPAPVTTPYASGFVGCGGQLYLRVSDACVNTNGESFIVEVVAEDFEDAILGGQFNLSYNENFLTFVDASVGDAPFTREVQNDIDPAGPGEIFYAVGLPNSTPPYMSTNGIVMARFEFTADAETCSSNGMVKLRSGEVPYLTRLTTPGTSGGGLPLYANLLLDLPELTLDFTPPVISCPADINTNADAGVCSATLNVTETFDNAVPLCASAGPGCWYVDRRDTSAFEQEFFDGDNRLHVAIAAADLDANSFYNYQGRKHDLTYGVGSTLSADLYIPADWGNAWSVDADSRHASIWATVTNSLGDISAYPIMGYTRSSTYHGFRSFDFVNGGWIDLGNGYLNAGTWHELSITLTDSDEFEFRINGALASTQPANGSVSFENVILQAYNFGYDYDVYWDNVTLGPEWATATDNCSVTISYERQDNASLTMYDPFPVGTTNIVWTATDDCGHTDQCTQTVTVADVEPPSIICPADINVVNDTGVCGATVTYPDPIVSDNCTDPGSIVVTLQSGLISGAVFPVGTTTVEYEAEDQYGNTATCSFNVTVTDSEAPSAVCQDITVYLDANGEVSITANDVDGGSADNCGIASLDISVSDFTCDELGDNDVTLTVTDTAGAMSTCVATVTVEDDIDPVITCPADITVNSDAGYCSAALSFAETFDTAVPTCASPSVSCWAVDRYAPAAFESDMFGGDARLRIGIDAADSAANRPGGFSGTFYNTQGYVRTLSNGSIGTTISADLYIPSSWATDVRRTDLWVRDVNPVEANAQYPIIGFSSNDPNDELNPNPTSPTPRFRYWDGDTINGWVDLATPVTYDVWHTLSITLTATSYEYRIDGTLVGTDNTVSEVGYEEWQSVYLQAYNFGETYDAFWDNLDLGPEWATATDNCSAAISYVRSDNAGYSLFDPFPAGVTTITWTATDPSGNTDQCTQTVTVNATNDFVVDIEVQGDIAGDFTRCVTFNFYEAGCTAPVEFKKDILFVEQGSGNGLGTAVFTDLPCGDYTCITAQDELHTLTRKLELSSGGDFDIVGTQYVADFTGPNMLIQGDYYDDTDDFGVDFIDIVDFGVWIAEFSSTYGDGDTECADGLTVHADAYGGGAVSDPSNYAFITASFAAMGDVPCCTTLLPADSPAADSITVEELKAMGLKRVARFDLDNDGVFDLRDVQAFMNGERPKVNVKKDDRVKNLREDSAQFSDEPVFESPAIGR